MLDSIVSQFAEALNPLLLVFRISPHRFVQGNAVLQSARDKLAVMNADIRRLEAEQTSPVVTGSCYAALMFGSLVPDVTAHDVQELARATVALYTPRGESGQQAWPRRAHRGVCIPPMGPGVRVG